ncbi:MAG: hypothetical protein Q4G49_16205 [Paracoccus sp. (in: a-proteobacteria)]|nr:hypothetical protein [Paracoccus sp. (in: a-proteobacteria)]
MLKPALLALCLAFPLSAMAFDASDEAAITTRFDQLLADIKAGNMASMLDVTPPPIFEAMAKQVGLSPQQLKDITTAQAAQMMDQVTIEDASYDLNAAEKSVSSTGRDYALIPTRTVMKMGDDRIEATGTTLALEDAGTWYLMRLDTPDHLAMVGQIYPDLAGLTMPQPGMRQLD